MRLAYHLLSYVQGHFHKLGKMYVPVMLCQLYFEFQKKKALMEKLLQIKAAQQHQCQMHSLGSSIKALILAK